MHVIFSEFYLPCNGKRVRYQTKRLNSVGVRRLQNEVLTLQYIHTMAECLAQTGGGTIYKANENLVEPTSPFNKQFAWIILLRLGTKKTSCNKQNFICNSYSAPILFPLIECSVMFTSNEKWAQKLQTQTVWRKHNDQANKYRGRVKNNYCCNVNVLYISV